MVCREGLRAAVRPIFMALNPTVKNFSKGLDWCGKLWYKEVTQGKKWESLRCFSAVTSALWMTRAA